MRRGDDKMKKEDLINYEIGKEYFFKVSSRKNRIKAILTSKDAVFTGLSLYHGTEAIQFKRKGTLYTLSLYGIESITS